MDGYQFPTISTSDLASSHAVEAMNEILSHSNEPIKHSFCIQDTY
jgi:non-specific riboncleoside hydrolase